MNMVEPPIKEKQIKKGDFKKALKSLKKELELEPNNVELLYKMGNLYHEANKTNKAIQYYEHAVKLNPNHIDALYNLGLSCEKVKNNNKAKECYKKIIRLHPSYIDSWKGLNNADSLYEKMIKIYKNIIGIDPYDLDGWEGLGDFYYGIKDYDKALVCYEKAVELASFDVDLWIKRGNSFAAIKEYKSATECYEKAIDIAPNQAISKNIPIIKSYEKLIEKDPKDVNLWINLGYVYEYMNNLDKAFECYEKALEIDPTHALARYKWNELYTIRSEL